MQLPENHVHCDWFTHGAWLLIAGQLRKQVEPHGIGEQPAGQLSDWNTLHEIWHPAPVHSQPGTVLHDAESCSTVQLTMHWF